MHFENHVGDDVFEIPETQARANWYGVSGIPHVVFDGTANAVGAGSCNGAANTYRDIINARMAETEGLSPVAISSSMSIEGANCHVTATYYLVDPMTLTDLRATLLLYEDNVYWCCGYGGEDTWQHTTRAIYDENIVLTALDNEVTVETTFPIAGYNPAELHAVAYLQQTSTKEMIQGQLVGHGGVLDYSLYFFHRLRSVPAGNGMAVFDAILTNYGDADDTFTLELGTAFGDWPADFLVCGDSNPHTDPLEIVLAPRETCEMQVRVHTDAMTEVRAGSFLVTSSFSGRMQETNLQVYNGSPSVLLVDDDRSHSDEVSLTNALDSLGYLYEDWDITFEHGGNSPGYAAMADFDMVIWHHSYWPQSDPLTGPDVNNLMNYMSNGGSFFLTSQLFLNDPLGPPEFITDYLGVDSYTLDHGYLDVSGVPGDPIGEGLTLPLSYPFGSLAKGDGVDPGATAEVCMTAPGDLNATLRNTMPNGAKSVFMAFPFNSISEDDPDPNNTRVVLQRILEWLAPQFPAGIDDGALSGVASRFDGIHPNPFNPRTEIVFILSNTGASGPVALAIYDLEGRQVARLFEGRLKSGTHSRTWGGLTDNGTLVRSGAYFARLTTEEGTVSRKMILLK